MRFDLPNSFRFTGSRSHALTVQRRLKDRYIPEITGVKYEDQDVEPPKPVSWYPDQLAWSMTTPKNVIRRFPPFANFQKFLVSENGVGNITRQEIVSMIPPLMMDLRPGMTVLDMCAAPGSKSVQMIEAIHGGEEGRVRKVITSLLQKGQREGSPGPIGYGEELEIQQAAEEGDYGDDGRATGLLIANDREYKRAQMLIHQCKRINSPNLIVTNHDATLYPSLKLAPDANGKQQYLKFDRILADVPCSGDGTARKNFDVWREWKVVAGLGMHTQQVRILMRALQMLKVGGRVVYSTCSMNPIENESVVSEAIQRCGGIDKVTITDTGNMLPGLERREGMRRWDVVDRKGKVWHDWDSVHNARASDERGEAAGKVTEGMFPPLPEHEIPLHRCVRVYPHLQDTGSFFITVLEKLSEIRARNDVDLPLPKADIPEPVKPVDAPITAMVKEIANQTPEEVRRKEAVSAADEAVPLPAEGPQLDPGRAPPVARQNSVDNPLNGDNKRPLDIDGAAYEPPLKAPKTRDSEVNAPGGPIDRMEHWPPPPSQAPSDHPKDNPVPTLSKDPSQAGLPTEPKEEPATNQTDVKPDPTPAAANITDPPAQRPSNTDQGYQSESFIYLNPSHPTLNAVRAFYALSPRFPKERYLVRNPAGDPVKGIYYTSSLVKDILEHNDKRGVKFVHAGVKMFVKQDVGHSKVKEEYDSLADVEKGKAWRIQNEGLPIIEHWVGGGRVIKLHTLSVLRILLKEMFIKISPDASFATFPKYLKEQLEATSLGCCLLRCEPSDSADDNDAFDERLVLPLWRGISSVNLMLPKEDRRAMLLRLFNESDAELIDNSNTKNQGQSKQKLQPIERRKQQERLRVKIERDSDDEDNEDGGVKLEPNDDEKIKIEDEGGPRRALEQTKEVAETVGGASGLHAVKTEVEEKDLARDAELQGQAQADVDLEEADGGERFNTTV